MQIQMEVCNLDVCDFIETRFKECENMEEWLDLSCQKGIILSTCNYGEMPNYEYFIYDANKYNNEKIFIENIQNIKQSKLKENTNEFEPLINIIWWYLDEFSCVVIPRNKEWFNASLPKILETWNVILKERVEGFQHRLPKKRISKCQVVFDDEKKNTTDGNDMRIIHF